MLLDPAPSSPSHPCPLPRLRCLLPLQWIFRNQFCCWVPLYCVQFELCIRWQHSSSATEQELCLPITKIPSSTPQPVTNQLPSPSLFTHSYGCKYPRSMTTIIAIWLHSKPRNNWHAYYLPDKAHSDLIFWFFSWTCSITMEPSQIELPHILQSAAIISWNLFLKIIPRRVQKNHPFSEDPADWGHF